MTTRSKSITMFTIRGKSDTISLSKSSAGGFVFLAKHPLISNHLGDFDTHLENEIDGFLLGKYENVSNLQNRKRRV